MKIMRFGDGPYDAWCYSIAIVIRPFGDAAGYRVGTDPKQTRFEAETMMKIRLFGRFETPVESL